MCKAHFIIQMVELTVVIDLALKMRLNCPSGQQALEHKKV